MAKNRSKTEESSVVDALSVAYSTVEELNDELTSWFENLPENLQGGSKGDALQEATGTLENVTEVDLPDCFAENIRVTHPALVRKPSRSDRCQYAIGALQAVADELRAQIDNIADDKTLSDEEREDQTSAMENCADEIEGHIGDLEGVEFPGMFS